MVALEDDVSNCLASVFVKLNSPDKQRQALSGLFKKLSLEQIRESFDLLNPINFKYDIIGNLPIEINAMILQQLQIQQLFQAQRVSRKWKWILSLPEILDPPLQQWDSMVETSLRIPEGLTPQAIRSLKAEHINAYRTGLPFSMMVYKLGPEYNPKRVHVAYIDGIVAWIDTTQRMVVVLLLETGAKYSYVSPNRELMTCITLSSSMVAVITLSGTCYVWEIPTGRAHSLRLTNISGDFSNTPENFFVSSGTTLAILHCSISTSDYLTTWNLKTRKSYHFPAIAREGEELIDSARLETRDKKIMIGDCGQSVVLFQQTDRPKEEAHFTRFSLDGCIQAHGSIEIPINSGCHKRFEDGRPLSGTKSSTILTYCQFFIDETSENPPQRLIMNSEDSNLRLLHVVYDSKQECFRLKRDFVRVQAIMPVYSAIIHSPDIFFWKDIVYCHADCGEAGLKIVDLTYDKCSIAHVDWYTSCDFQRRNDRDEDSDDGSDAFYLARPRPNRHPWILGDETYLLRVFEGGFVVWCFDKNITMVNEDMGYRKFRESAEWKCYTETPKT